MNKKELRDVLELVKDKLQNDTEPACGLFWPDASPTSRYAVGEEDATSVYSTSEEDSSTWYSVGEEDSGGRYAIGE